MYPGNPEPVEDPAAGKAGNLGPIFTAKRRFLWKRNIVLT